MKFMRPQDEERQERILAAARQLFASIGFRGTVAPHTAASTLLDLPLGGVTRARVAGDTP